MVRRPDDRIPVEPLSEARWARIERSLAERLEDEAGSFDEPVRPTPRWRSPAVAWVAGVAAVAAGLFLARGVFWGAPSSASSHIETGEAASHLRMGGASISVAPHTEVSVSGDEDRGVVVVLDKGEVDCEVAPRHEHPPFVVQAGEVRVRVIGTRFAVKRDGRDVSVDVTRGVVEVDAHGETDRVPAGAHWPAETTSAASDTNASGGGAPPQEPSAPASSAATPPARAATRHPAGPSTNRDLAPPTAEETPTVASSTSTAAAPVPSPLASAARTQGTPTAQQRYEAAAQLEARDPVAALALYRQVARDGSDAWSANALYAAGRLQADRGARAEAQALLQEYLARFPHGPNAPDAHDLIGRLVHATP